MTQELEAALYQELDDVIEVGLEDVVERLKRVITHHSYLGKLKEFEEFYVNPIDQGFDDDILKHRLNLMFEELSEIAVACGNNVLRHYYDNLLRKKIEELANIYFIQDNPKDPVEILDGLLDLQYVLSGTVIRIGLSDFDKAFAVVHKNNMGKYFNSYAEAAQRAEKLIINSPEMSEVKIIPCGDKYILKINGKVIKPANHVKPSLSEYVQE